MNLKIGQKIAYPNHGVCAVESIESKQIGGNSIDFYSLRLLSNNSVILVPKDNAEIVGLRPVIKKCDCEKVLVFLAEDFDEPESDWKLRIRDFGAKVQSGDVFAAADVLKKLTWLAQSKQLSFREQRLLEKAEFLVISELSPVQQIIYSFTH